MSSATSFVERYADHHDATVATVGARHASYLNFPNDEDLFPPAFETAKRQEDPLDAASGFIESCPDQ